MADGKDTQENSAQQVSKKVDAETARLEVERFLDFKRVPKTRREKDFEVNITALETMVMDGRMVFDFEKKRAIFKLLAPLEAKESGTIKELSMRFFIGMQAMQNALKKTDLGDIYGRSLAMAANLAGISDGILGSAKNEFGENGMDTGDVNSLIHYITFFLA